MTRRSCTHGFTLRSPPLSSAQCQYLADSVERERLETKKLGSSQSLETSIWLAMAYGG